MDVSFPFAFVRWIPCYRIIPTRQPSVHVFEKVADPEDYEALFELEGMTNDRLRVAQGKLPIVPPQIQYWGVNESYIMAPFAHLNPHGSRFSNGTWGVYYAAKELETAVAETVYHRERFMRATNEKPMALPMQILLADFKGRLHDLRKVDGESSLYSKDDYTASQQAAAKLKREDSPGVVYKSVRKKGGQCIGVFKPNLLANPRFDKNLIYQWDGKKILGVYEKIF